MQALLHSFLLSLSVALPLPPAELRASDRDLAPQVLSMQQRASGYYELQVLSLSEGHNMLCTLYDASGWEIVSNTWISRAPQTTVPILYPGKDVREARCQMASNTPF